MLRTENGKQMSFFSMLYDKIPEDHVLKRIWNVVDLQKIKFKIYAQPAVPKKKDYFFSGFEPSPVL